VAWTLSASRAVYTACYVAAAGVAVVTALALPTLLPGVSPFLRVTLAGAAATLFLYVCGVVFKNSGFYDVYWSLYPVVAGVSWMFAHDAWQRPTALLALAATSLWGLRLTFNWARHFEGLDHEDWRYVDLRRKTGKVYPLASFGALHLFPFTLVTLGTLPLEVAISSSDAASVRPLAVLHVVALAVGVTAVVLESISDEQLRRFRQSNEDPQAFMCSGLWAYSRHPNYCGEVMYWWSAALFGLAAAPSPWLVLGAVGVTAMVLFASIPMAEERALAKRPRFADYQRRVSRLVPWFPQRD